MKKLLSSYWNVGIATGEIVGSILLIFFIMSISFLRLKHFSDSKTLKFFGMPFLFSIGAMVAIFVGMSFGSAIGAEGSGLALSNPILALSSSIIFDSFKALVYILPLEFLGSLIGLLLFWLLLKGFSIMDDKKYLLHDYLLLDKELETSKVVIKNIIGSIVLSLIFVFVPILDKTAYDVGLFMSTLVSSLLLTIPLILTANWNYFSFSITIHFANVIFGLFKKKEYGFQNNNYRTKIIKDFTLVLITQTTIVLSLAYLCKGLENWSSFFHYHA